MNGREESKWNDLFFVCSLIEYVGRMSLYIPINSTIQPVPYNRFPLRSQYRFGVELDSPHIIMPMAEPHNSVIPRIYGCYLQAFREILLGNDPRMVSSRHKGSGHVLKENIIGNGARRGRRLIVKRVRRHWKFQKTTQSKSEYIHTLEDQEEKQIPRGQVSDSYIAAYLLQT